VSSTRRAAASTAAGGSISGLPSVKSKTLSAPRSALRRAPSSNMRRIHDAFVRLSVTARETITAAATILWRPREGEWFMAQARGGPGVTSSKPVPEIYRRLGVRPIIHASGTTTRYGGSILRAEALEAMREASTTLVNMDELNAAAGAAIARMLGAEAAFVTAGASSGLILQAAACIAGADPAKVTRLPDTRGMRNEIIIQRAHRFAYDQAYRVAGGVLVEIGQIGRASCRERV